MTINIGINGYGRIGRNILRALYESESDNHKELKIVAINDVGDNSVSAHLTKYDSAHGKFNKEVTADSNFMYVDNDKINITSERDPSKINWGKYNVDVVFECTGKFNSKEGTEIHIKNGAKKVIISAPGKNVDATIVCGVNEGILSKKHTIISNASCTTNCIAPVIKVLNDAIGVEHGLITTIHSFTNDQRLTDANHTDIRRARAATLSMIPTKTGAAKNVGLVIPELEGKLDGLAVRIPTVNVSVVDLVVRTKKNTSIDEVNKILLDASKNEMKDIVAFNEIPLVSTDFNHNPASSIYDSNLTKVMDDRLVKVYVWYDNEWGFSNRMLDVTLALMNAK
ncbi:MAG: type I glyceraldehyde-3-phosphate dehydrogenase [Gammaproteobacteria bacterium]|jgi:glyceraldehyde 3-phosphate dehydrogenase|nr:type I glyceraldehyde-3-phosphate dehydrogenase [Gammaproteobacteria bacterium]|tara:strand:- start:6745 stop:7761 length:1017 start_codon:yes stop_codon:yes gene_type:complete